MPSKQKPFLDTNLLFLMIEGKKPVIKMVVLSEGFSGTTIRTHGQNQGGGRKQGREVSLPGVGYREEEKMQTTVIEQQ